MQLDDLSHLLRLRSRLRLTDKLSAEVGADLDVGGQAIYPKSALEYKVRIRTWLAQPWVSLSPLSSSYAPTSLARTLLPIPLACLHLFVEQ